jgi:hypothetical protein
MDLLVNDRSLHGQFHDVEAFREAIGRLMRIRQIARRYGRSLYCHRGLASARATSQHSMQAAVNALPREQRSAFLAWLNQQGPFWDDERQHDMDDWYECAGEVVTDTAIGEAAHCLLHGIDRGLASFQPSNFLRDPLAVEWVGSDTQRTSVDVRNFWEPGALEDRLAEAPPALDSWAALNRLCAARFQRLTFAGDAFNPLQGQPFKQSVAERILARLDVLHRLSQCFEPDGSRSLEGHALYQKHFTGDKAWFSDSSDSEKTDFKDDLTFPHPDTPDQYLFCTWHGKVKSPQYRLHFSWPITATTLTYVVYVGPKITKR